MYTSRREIMGLMAAALCTSCVSAAEPTTAPSNLPEKWWEGRDFYVDDYPATEWIWPRDRLIVFESRDKSERVMIPVFDVRIVGGDEEVQLKLAIEHYLETHLGALKLKDQIISPHVCLIRVDGYPTLIGVYVAEDKPHVCMDQYADVLKRANERLEKK